MPSKYGHPRPTNQAVVVAHPRPGTAISAQTPADYGTLGAIINRDANVHNPAFLTNQHVVPSGGGAYHPPYFGGHNPHAAVIGTGRTDSVSRDQDAIIVDFAPGVVFDPQLEVETDTQGVVHWRHAKILAPTVGMWVEKVGATTGYTIGYVDHVTADGISVVHAPGPQLVTWQGHVTNAGFTVAEIPNPPPLCDGGDSGAVWCEIVTRKAVALHRRSSGAGAGQTAQATRLDFLAHAWTFTIRTT